MTSVTPDVVDIAGSHDLLAAATATGDVIGIDPTTGRRVFTTSTDGGTLVAGDSSVWLWRSDRGTAARLTSGGAMGGDVVVGDATGVAGVGDEVWWLDGSLRVRSSAGTVFDTPLAGPAAASTVCGGSMWLSSGAHLEHVSLFSGKTGNPLASPVGALVVLGCSGNRIIGANGDGTAAVMDPAADALFVTVDQPPVGAPLAAVGTKTVGWVVGADRAIILAS